MRTTTEILKTVMPVMLPPEPGRYDFVTNPDFKPEDPFIANISRLVLQIRTNEAAKKAATAQSQSQAQAAPAPRRLDASQNITRNGGYVTKVWGGNNDDKINVTAEKVHWISTYEGDDTITIRATGSDKATEGMAAMDSGSVTSISAGDGNDVIDIQAENLVHNILAGAGEDTVLIAANYVSKIGGHGGDDTIVVAAHSVDGVSGDNGDDTIDIVSTREKGLEEVLAFSSNNGWVQHVQGGTGNDKIDIKADINVDYLDAGAGNDTMTVAAGEFLSNVKMGQGDDSLTASAGWEINRIDTGAGNDKVALTAHAIADVQTGAGNDQIDLDAETTFFLNTGAGADTLYIRAWMGDLIDAGAGDDTLVIDGRLPDTPLWLGSFSEINGGDGSDKIIMTARYVGQVAGGNGNDEINIDADSISEISGGKGDDTLVLQQTSHDRAISIYMAEGDGNDTLTTGNDLEIKRFSADGTRELGLAGAKLEKLGTDKFKLTFAGGKDSITINYSEPGRIPGTYFPRIDGNRIVLDPPAA